MARVFGARHLALAELPSGDVAIPSLILVVGAESPGNLRAAKWVGAVLAAVDASRHASARIARGAMAARLKEVVRRRPQCRAALPAERQWVQCGGWLGRVVGGSATGRKPRVEPLIVVSLTIIVCVLLYSVCYICDLCDVCVCVYVPNP